MIYRTFFIFFIFSAHILQSSDCTSDLDFIRKTILENHPGVYNKEDPEFVIHMEKAYMHACMQKKQKQALIEFVKSFEDNHVALIFNDQTKTKVPAPTNISMRFDLEILFSEITWVTVPSFHNLTDKQKQEYLKLLIELEEHRNDKLIIFDLRANQGGNSDLGTKLLEALFGTKYVQNKITCMKKNQSVDWRASQNTIDKLASHYTNFEHDFGPNDEKSLLIKSCLDGCKKSLLQGDVYYHELENILEEHKSEPKEEEEEEEEEEPLFNATIGVIIRHGHASAVLDFIDELYAITKNVRLIGQETGSDRLYMDCAILDLPSRAGKFLYPVKVFRNRPRTDKETCKPDFKFHGDITDTAVLQKFVKKHKDKLIKANLKK